MKKMGEKGQVEGIVNGGVLLIGGAVMTLVLAQILPVLLDNHISPQIENRTFGSTGILMYELLIPLFIIVLLMAVLMMLNRRPQVQ